MKIRVLVVNNNDMDVSVNLIVVCKLGTPCFSAESEDSTVVMQTTGLTLQVATLLLLA